jgi:nitroreductase
MRTPASQVTHTVLEHAALASLHAPSVFNTQPWKWRIYGPVMQLWADPARRLETVDPDGRLMLLSCGAVLHHARVALAAAGRAVTVGRLPDPDRPDLLAVLRLGPPAPADPEAVAMAGAITRRRTDRRAFGPRQVPVATLQRLRALVGRSGAYLHLVRLEQLAMLAVAADLAGSAELDDPDYLAELDRWTHRPPTDGDGVPVATAVHPGPRSIPVRDFDPERTGGLPAGPGRDRGASYVVVYGDGTGRADLLRGGEAMSALLLAATAEGLATAPLSDAVEVTWPRHLVRSLVAGLGEPYVVVRLGYPASAEPLPAVPRRAPDTVIEVRG